MERNPKPTITKRERQHAQQVYDSIVTNPDRWSGPRLNGLRSPFQTGFRVLLATGALAAASFGLFELWHANNTEVAAAPSATAPETPPTASPSPNVAKHHQACPPIDAAQVNESLQYCEPLTAQDILKVAGLTALVGATGGVIGIGYLRGIRNDLIELEEAAQSN